MQYVREAPLSIARQLLPMPTKRWLYAKWQRREFSPAVGRVRFGSWRRTSPISPDWGYDRGQPIDRYYIEQFLKTQRAAICGHVLEIKDTTYTDRFGRNVTHADVLDIEAANLAANQHRGANIRSSDSATRSRDGEILAGPILGHIRSHDALEGAGVKSRRAGESIGIDC